MTGRLHISDVGDESSIAVNRTQKPTLDLRIALSVTYAPPSTRDADQSVDQPRRQTHSPDRDAWVDDLPDKEFAQMFGPNWAKMTRRQRDLYPDGLSEREMDLLWSEAPEGDDHAP